jgi:hypothetical protein
MKKYLLMAVFACIIIGLPIIAYANADRDNVNDLLDQWLDYADENDYNVLDNDVDRVDEDTNMIYTIDLEEGDYVIFAQGGDNIRDLNLFGYYQDDYDDGDDPFIEDTLDDNIPVLEFTLEHSETIVVVVSGERFARGEDRGYYCILFCEEG